MRPSTTLIIFLICWTLCSCTTTPPAAERKAEWADPMALVGVPNLHKVSDDLYRSGQPSGEGMQNLEAMGIKTIVNLRSFHSDDDEVEGTSLQVEHITMKAWHPETKEAKRFLRIVSDPNNTPVLVHCMHGSDRTGTMCAIYRIANEGWSKEDAIDEMQYGGYGFHEIWQNLPAWIRGLEMEKIKP